MSQNNAATQTRTFRRLEELNLIDDFLFHTMLLQKEDGEEFARILLQTILGKPIRKVKVIPQKEIPGIDTNRHGVRLDAYIRDVSGTSGGELVDAEIIPDLYDLEPNNTYEKEYLPKRIRYYHGLIDTQLLSSGTGYQTLPNVVIIVILPYDPFNKKRMVYTIQNQCKEDPSVPYNDGAKKIYLYTKGTEGNPGKSLSDMLKYIEKTTENNVTNKDLAVISRLVRKVKSKKEVGIQYMKSWEHDKMMRDEGYNEGYGNGTLAGNIQMQERINRLIINLAHANRSDDILKAAQDKEYQEALFQEFGL